MEDTFTELWPTLILKRKFPAHEEHKQGVAALVNAYALVNDYMEQNPVSRQASENRNLYESEYGIIPQFHDQVPEAKSPIFFVDSFIQISSRANARIRENE